MSAELPAASATPEETVEAFEQIARGMTWSKALYSVVLFLFCLAVMKTVMTLIDRTMTRLKVEPTVHKFTRSCLKVLLWIVTGLVVAGYLEFPVNSLVTVLGVIGVALSLSLQGSLSNLAGGIMVMASRPFAMGDYVEAGGVAGTVHEIGLIYTKLKTIDNKIIFIPNGEISGEKIVNYNKQEQRRVDLTFTVSYDADPEQVKEIMRQVIGAHPKALFTPEPFVRTTELGESSVSYTLRAWCATEDYWDLYFDLLEQVRAAFDREGVELTYNHLNVHIMKE
ncbi:mechanosensitive ion channel family protein [Intestinimonas sp.]|uniref:mechanosensitive ion channel family protein n=1 Tax=Intestinimonas sp. TaxID=1965293 RepID=UPI00261B75A0|nr:mechanosensitive ion channel family protein [Intestinimonas sp.]